jgi:probable H4MPT-linked C1 transfer pathway protein
MNHWLGIDIGGANIKLADGKDFAKSVAFELWRNADTLALELRTLIAESPQTTHLAITMTGELADCYANKEAGVNAILSAVEQAADGRHTRIYLTNGKFVSVQAARRNWPQVAAANWHALATFASKIVNQKFMLLLDIGSTTTDVVPVMDGVVVSEGETDTDRLISRELVYTGIQRSSVVGLVSELPYRDLIVPICNELFATTLDAWLILGEIPESPALEFVADSGPATKAAARTRLSRLISADPSQFNHRDAAAMAEAIARRQTEIVAGAVQTVTKRLPQPIQSVVVTGHGEFLARRALKHVKYDGEIISLSKRLTPEISRCATAFAVATLAAS